MKDNSHSEIDVFDACLERNFQDIANPEAAFPMDRRDFVKLLGAGIVILVSIPRLGAQQGGRRRGQQLPDDLNAFLRIGEDGKVTGFTGKIEMGQGIVTSLAQMLAEQLDVELDTVEMVMGDTDRCPWDMGTFGSMTTRFFGPPFRAAAAEAKAVLVELAAERLSVPRDQLRTANGAVHDHAGRSITYGELTKGQRIVRKLDRKAVEDTPSEFTITGKPALRKDAKVKVTGEALYAGDIRRPGMLYASILRPPSHAAKVTRVDTSAARKQEGVHVVEQGDLVAVLHEYPDIAARALKAVKADFDLPESDLNQDTIFEHVLRSSPAGETVAQGGTLAEGEQAAEQVIEATYLDGYVAHAPMEPHTALADVQREKTTIWASTQTPFRLKESAARQLGVLPEKVRVITPFVGGGFGGKTSNRQALEAVRLSKAVGKPVQVAWTRAEEFFYDTFRPAAVVKIKAGTAASGAISFWDYRVYSAGQRGSEQYYDIPHHKTVVYGSGWRAGDGGHPFGTGAWRAPANNTNTFARESHIDMLAARAGLDPIEFRLQNLKDKRMRRVLEAVAEKANWKPVKSPSGRGFGVATGIDAGTYVAHIAEVQVNRRTGKVQVKRVICAQDMGLCVNPAGAELQMEGCVMMGLGYTLTEEIRFTGGAIHDSNFDTYKIPRFSWLPEIETVILDLKEDPAQGGGEPAIICVGAVIANSIFDATGARLFRLPMTPERVKEALSNI